MRTGTLKWLRWLDAPTYLIEGEERKEARVVEARRALAVEEQELRDYRRAALREVLEHSTREQVRVAKSYQKRWEELPTELKGGLS